MSRNEATSVPWMIELYVQIKSHLTHYEDSGARQLRDLTLLGAVFCIDGAAENGPLVDRCFEFFTLLTAAIPLKRGLKWASSLDKGMTTLTEKLMKHVIIALQFLVCVSFASLSFAETPAITQSISKGREAYELYESLGNSGNLTREGMLENRREYSSYYRVFRSSSGTTQIGCVGVTSSSRSFREKMQESSFCKIQHSNNGQPLPAFDMNRP